MYTHTHTHIDIRMKVISRNQARAWFNNVWTQNIIIVNTWHAGLVNRHPLSQKSGHVEGNLHAPIVTQKFFVHAHKK